MIYNNVDLDATYFVDFHEHLFIYIVVSALYTPYEDYVIY
jgi:hypothetical protein